MSKKKYWLSEYDYTDSDALLCLAKAALDLRRQRRCYEVVAAFVIAFEEQRFFGNIFHDLLQHGIVQHQVLNSIANIGYQKVRALVLSALEKPTDYPDYHIKSLLRATAGLVNNIAANDLIAAFLLAAESAADFAAIDWQRLLDLKIISDERLLITIKMMSERSYVNARQVVEGVLIADKICDYEIEFV